MYICVCVYTYTYIYIRINIHIYVCTYIHTYVYVYRMYTDIVHHLIDRVATMSRAPKIKTLLCRI